MKDFDFVEFYNNLQKNITDVNRLISEIEFKYSGELRYLEEGDIDIEEELTFYLQSLVYQLESIKLKIEFAYDYLSLGKMSDKFTTELKEFDGKFSQLDYVPFIDIFFSPVLSILLRHVEALTSHVRLDTGKEFQEVNDFILLEQILRGTAKILTDRNIEPHNETIIKKEVYNTLIHVFPDTVKEISIHGITKNYKPDLGIKKLKCAIEFKFVDSIEEGKTAIEGIFADTHGYEGSADWKIFYAVIYLTKSYLTPAQLEEEFKVSKVPDNWRLIPVYGSGERRRSTKLDTQYS